MNKIKSFFNAIANEIKRVKLPVVAIGAITVCSIVCCWSSENFRILDFFIQLALGVIWTLAVYSIGILVINEQKKKGWKAHLYLLIDMIFLGCYVVLEYYMIYKYLGIPLAL